MKVRKIMTADVETCSPEDDLAKVVEIMWRRDCGVVPITDDEEKVAGIITDRDIAIASASKNRVLSKIKVADLIGEKIIVCNADDKSEDALKKMRKYKIKRLPVLDETEKLVGILSISDVLLKDKKSKKTALKVLQNLAKPRPIILTAIAETDI